MGLGFGWEFSGFLRRSYRPEEVYRGIYGDI